MRLLYAIYNVVYQQNITKTTVQETSERLWMTIYYHPISACEKLFKVQRSIGPISCIGFNQ